MSGFEGSTGFNRSLKILGEGNFEFVIGRERKVFVENEEFNAMQRK